MKMIVSSGPQLSPRPPSHSHNVMVGPPVMETFFKAPATSNPIHCPSGEMTERPTP